jgi:hypothetical protein
VIHWIKATLGLEDSMATNTTSTNDSLTGLFWRRIGLSFARAFIAALIAQAAVIWSGLAENVADGTVDWNAGAALIFAAISGACAAGIRAAQAKGTQLETDPRLKK